jgi:nucleoside-diphosphate-sugar epimerase
MSDWSDIRVLVTGATGFLAQHLIPELLNRGSKVAGLSLGKQSNLNLKNFSYINIDLKDKNKLRKVIKKINPEKIFHLAAYPDKDPTFENTDQCIQNNIQGTLNLIHSLGKIDYGSLVHIGSYKEYSGSSMPFKESDAIFPVSPYAISKACAEMYCKAYHELYGFPLVSLRFPTIYGPKQPAKNLVPYLIMSSLNNSQLKLTKGEQKRELIYVSDVMDAMINASLSKRAQGEIINVGTNKEHTLKEIVNTVVKLTKSKIKPVWGAIPYRKNEIWSMRGDNGKAKKLLDWKPKTGLKQGLIKTIDYYKNA